MKLFSKDGQTMVDVQSLDITEDGKLVMDAKLMGAYNTVIYLTPYELRHATTLLKKGMVWGIIKMFMAGKKAEPTQEKAQFSFAK